MSQEALRRRPDIGNRRARKSRVKQVDKRSMVAVKIVDQGLAMSDSKHVVHVVEFNEDEEVKKHEISL